MWGVSGGWGGESMGGGVGNQREVGWGVSVGGGGESMWGWGWGESVGGGVEGDCNV